MKIYLATILLGGVLVFTSCNESQGETEIENVSHMNDTDKIQLNGGEKWVVAPEMMAHIQSMQNGVQLSTEIGLDSLAIQLNHDLDLLTSNCTMTGQAHDELHKWLLPFIQLVDRFDVGKGVDKENSYEELVVSFEEFNQFFI